MVKLKLLVKTVLVTLIFDPALTVKMILVKTEIHCPLGLMVTVPDAEPTLMALAKVLEPAVESYRTSKSRLVNTRGAVPFVYVAVWIRVKTATATAPPNTTSISASAKSFRTDTSTDIFMLSPRLGA